MITVADLREQPLKRGDALLHGIMGIVLYAAKVRNHPELVIVKRTDTNERVKVPLHHLSREASNKKTQATRLILCHCDECLLKVRVSRLWLSVGVPTCWNEHCKKQGEPLIVEMGGDDANPGKLDIDRAERIRQANHEQAGTSAWSDDDET